MPFVQELRGLSLKALVHLDYVDVVTEEKLKLDYRILLPQQQLIWFGFGIGGVELLASELSLHDLLH
jgi:hypothetical protein